MSKHTDTTEKGLESHIAHYLVTENNYVLRDNKVYNNTACLDTELLFNFLEATQPKAVAKLKTFHKDLYEQKIIKRLNDQIQAKGVIEVLRKGIVDGFTDTKLQLFYDKPVSGYNADANTKYQANIFSVMRQVYFSPKDKKSLDMMVFINGIPVISFELKNELTKQNVKHAIKQYKEDRDPNEELFRLGRLIVNFAVDTDEVWMCTQLKGEKSYFLPFNKGNNNGAGNPPNEGIKTDYLWTEILTKNSLTDIVMNFCQLVTEEKEYTDDKGKKRTRKETKLIFPRYHQLVAVRQLLAKAQTNGAGQKYLIQHSAGSGKSNSISWLAHQLVGLHDKSGKDNIFDTVIVITDRRVLDKQIRDNIKQFQQVNGVVEAITEGSKQLKQALEEGKKIIITTIQKFPHIVAEIGDLPSTNFAIIIDEAHSSLSGQMARKLNEALAKPNEDDELETEDHDTITGEDLIINLIKSRKLLPKKQNFRVVWRAIYGW
jgi:type I restriction enzyme R subunit